MAFVKLDVKILNSTIWQDADACKLFITSLLMAEPMEVREPLETVQIGSCEPDAFVVPVGWYGFVPAAGPGISHRAIVPWEDGQKALVRLASPEAASKTAAFEGRRMVRIDGGFLILNFITYRDRDHSNADRQARFRQREKERKERNASGDSNALPVNSNGVKVTTVTHADADADAEAKSKAKAKTRAAPLALPDWLPPEVWQDWHNFRNDRKGWTAKARTLSLRTLGALWAAGADPRKVIDQSIERGWTGLFPIKSGSQTGTGKLTPSRQGQALAEAMAQFQGNGNGTDSGLVLEGNFSRTNDPLCLGSGGLSGG